MKTRKLTIMKIAHSKKYTYRIVKLSELYYVQIQDSEDDWTIIGFGESTISGAVEKLRKFIDEDNEENYNVIDFEL